MSEFWRPDDRMALENDHPRYDVTEKVTGRAKYSTDYYPDKLIWAAFIRCPYGVAKVTNADVEAAKKAPGVLDVQMDKMDGVYCGDHLGTICAESRQAIEDGIAALKLAFDIGEAKTDPLKQLPPREQWANFTPPTGGGPAGRGGGGGRRGGRGGRAASPEEIAAANAAATGADHMIEAVYETQVQTHCCLEPHNVLVDYRGDHAIAWGSSQGTFAYRDQLTRPLNLSADKVEFHCEYIGGGFGSKLGQTPEGVLASQMSVKFNRPCRVLLTRKEEQLDTGNRPGSIQYMKIGVSKDGTIAGGRMVAFGIAGAMSGGGGVRAVPRYKMTTPAVSSAMDVTLSAGGVRPMRAPGAPQYTYAYEMLMEELAQSIGMDSLEFRQKNDVDPVRQEMYKVGAELIGWKDRKASKDQKGPIKTGFGVAAGDWGNGGFGNATVTVNIYPDGRVEVLSGCQDIGQGFRTLVGDCVATTLDIPYTYLAVKVGVSNLPNGPGSGGSSTSRTVAPRAFLAAQQARDGILGLVAKEMKLPDASKLKIEKGMITGDIKPMAWTDACKLINGQLTYTTSDLPEGMGQNTQSQCVQFVKLNVDTETGVVRVEKIVALQEVGKPVNRNTIENQITGACIEGIGYALFEDRILNAATGVMNNANLEMYKCPGAVDIPEIVPVIWRSDPNSPVNAVGEPPSVPIAGALGCAIYNAIGVPVRKMPMTPRRVLAALGGEKGAVA